MKEDLDQYELAYDEDVPFNYDMNIWFSCYIKRLKQLMKGSTCLELGVGHGHTTNIFSQHIPSYKVIEGSPKIIERFKSKHPDTTVDIIEGYFEDFNTTEKFDVILMGYVLEHVDNPKQILDKYKKMLIPNGSIFAVVPNGSSLNRRFGLKAGYLKSLDEMSEFDYKCGHKRTFTYESLMSLIEQCNLYIERCEGIFFKVMSSQQMIDAKIPENVMDAMCEVAMDYPELAGSILVELKYKVVTYEC